MTRRAVFLDRDGVLNRAVVRDGKPYPPASVDELEIPDDVPAALAALKSRGFALIVVTNQPDVARGTQTREQVEAIHARLASRLPLDEFRVCYHDDADACECRKPKPGLLTRPPHYDLRGSVLIGDRWRDIEAGRRAGVGAVILVDAGHSEAVRVAPDAAVGSLRQAAEWILEQTGLGHEDGR